MQSSRIVYATKLFPKLMSPSGLASKSVTDSTQRSCNRELLSYYGFISDAIGASTFVQLPSFRRSLKKLIKLVEKELQYVGGQEVLLPTIVPQRLWHHSERIKRDPKCLDSVYELIDHDDRKLLLGPTFEESITHLMKHIGGSIKEQELPLLLYQSSPKFRLESNPKFGIIRSNEFFMNDLYTFDADIELAKKTYDTISQCYENIFAKLSLECIKTEGSQGNIGGKYSHEYQLPIGCGQDIVIRCDSCQHASNIELRVKDDNSTSCPACNSSRLQKIPTIELGHTFLLSDTYSKPMNAKYSGSKGREFFQMGCFGLGLTRIIGAGIDLLSLKPHEQQGNQLYQLRWPTNIEPYDIGLIPPAKRSRQYEAGSSQFVEQFLLSMMEKTKNVDFLIEDRDKEGIGQRLVRLKSLGVPNIIVIGQKFLDDIPQYELFKLNKSTSEYEQRWFTQEQLEDYICREIDC